MIDDVEFCSWPQLAAQFPVRFPNGAHWDLFQARCNGCREVFANEELRGLVSQTVADVYLIEALGRCRACARFTPVRYRLHADMSVTGISPHTKTWVRWAPRPSWWRRLLRWWAGA